MFTEPPKHLSDWTTPARTAWVIRERIAYEQVAILYRTTQRPLWSGLVFGGVCAGLIAHLQPWPWALAWWLALAGLSAWRSWEIGRFEADPQRRVRAGHWRQRYLVALTPYVLCWSALLLSLDHPPDAMGLAFVMISLVGVASVGVFTTNGVFGASVVWLVACVAPAVVFCLMTAVPATLALAAGAMLFIGVMLHEAWRSSRLQAEMLRLRLENAAIAEDRAQALAMAEQHSRAKTRFLATVSHEMRTPLNGIVGISELLRDVGPDETTRSRAHIVLQSAEQLDRVIGDLLDLSRLEFGRLHIGAEPFDPAQLLRDVVAAFSPQAADHGLALAQQVAPAVPRWVSGDPARVQQVLSNLLSNALRLTTAGHIRITLEPVAQGLRYTVEDTGPGIDAERLDSIFDPFDRPDVEVERRRQGFGVGLAVARRLARAMGGDITCASSPGRGSTFGFTLQAPAVPHAPPGADEPLPRLLGQVLVVDDNEVNALVAQTMLQRLGIEAHCVADGEQALQALAIHRFDAVLMDCRMPVLDGWQATRRWREAEARRGGPGRLPIVGVTANVSEADRDHCREAGMDDFLPKPFRIQDLAAVLQPFLGQAPPRPSPPEPPPATLPGRGELG